MDYKNLMEEAKKSSQQAYAKYSNFPVGACLLMEDGKIYAGCNVENASYSLTICAERNAIFSAVHNGSHKISAVAIYSPKMDNCYPCGACRQVIHEFASDNGVDVITEVNGELEVNKINELLPKGFNL